MVCAALAVSLGEDRRRRMSDCQLYLISPLDVAGPFPDRLERALAASGPKGPVAAFQFRVKGIDQHEATRLAGPLQEICAARDVAFIVNDSIALAKRLNADGVHLGQGDLPPKHARELLGKDAIIGYSTHNLAQAVEAMSEPIDYIAIGPVFQTTTKADHDPVIGLDAVRSVRQAIGNFPLVAIGGITLEKTRSVLDAGVDSVAIIGAIHVKGTSIKDNIHHLLNILRR